ncbi:MAG: gliding motility protein GldN [Saprospiraceae bacterium]|nr:gliding motility protein GldN [Saprospiraceae bacterium]
MTNLRFLIFIGLSTLCSLTINAQGGIDETITESSILEDTSGFIDDIIDRKAVVEQRVLSYEPIREADIVWEKRIWRVIDTREKMNQVFMEFNRPFFLILKDAAERGDIKMFAEDNFKKSLSTDELDKLLHSVDTQEIYNPDTYETEIRIIRNDIDYNDIKTYRVKELWYFDKEASRMGCRILGIAPIKIEIDESTGLAKYEAPMFWVYYPEVRKILAKERVFNGKNDIAPATWADVFDGRFFASYIFKESNVQNVRLQDIFTGEDDGVKLLLESEKIKNKLLDFEHDLWVY